MRILNLVRLRREYIRTGRFFLLSALFCSPFVPRYAYAQTRAELLEKGVDEKAANVKEWQPDKAEQVYQRALRNPVVKGFLSPENGWTVQFGGLYPGSGFALGPKYVKRGLAHEQLDLTFSTAGSFNQVLRHHGGGVSAASGEGSHVRRCGRQSDGCSRRGTTTVRGMPPPRTLEPVSGTRM